MRSIPSEIAESVLNWVTHAPADNTIATQTLAATAKVRHVLKRVWASYSEAPAANTGLLTVTATVGGSALVFTISMPAAGPQQFEFDLVGDVNTLITVALGAGGGTCEGKVTLCYK